VRINCYKNADWPNVNKDDIDNAIKKCLEVCFSFFILSHLKNRLRLIKLFPKKKIDNNNKQLEGAFNNRYKMVKKLGSGAQGTVYEVEDLNENGKK
jgi:hypothetical protein